jgi:hypothetical protein
VRLTAVLLVAALGTCSGAVLHRRGGRISHTAAGVSQRKRLHVNDLITEPGTVEIDSGYLYSWTTGSITLPTALKWTPDGDSLLLGRTEYSVAFDSVNSAASGGLRSTQFSDRLSLTTTSVIYDSEHFDVAVAPQLTTLLRNDSGIRAGATVVGRLDAGGNTVAGTAGWSGATSPSDSNPAGVWDMGAGYARKLGRFTPHMTVVWENATGFERTISVFGGVEYQCSEQFAVDVTAQRYSLAGPGPDRQVLVGVTWNFGHGGKARSVP